MRVWRDRVARCGSSRSMSRGHLPSHGQCASKHKLKRRCICGCLCACAQSCWQVPQRGHIPHPLRQGPAWGAVPGAHHGPAGRLWGAWVQAGAGGGSLGVAGNLQEIGIGRCSWPKQAACKQLAKPSTPCMQVNHLNTFSNIAVAHHNAPITHQAVGFVDSAFADRRKELHLACVRTMHYQDNSICTVASQTCATRIYMLPTCACSCPPARCP